MISRKTIRCSIGALNHRLKEIRGDLKNAEFFNLDKTRYLREEKFCTDAIAELQSELDNWFKKREI
jgi:hypothetical protein